MCLPPESLSHLLQLGSTYGFGCLAAQFPHHLAQASWESLGSGRVPLWPQGRVLARGRVPLGLRGVSLWPQGPACLLLLPYPAPSLIALVYNSPHLTGPSHTLLQARPAPSSQHTALIISLSAPVKPSHPS